MHTISNATLFGFFFFWLEASVEEVAELYESSVSQVAIYHRLCIYTLLFKGKENRSTVKGVTWARKEPKSYDSHRLKIAQKNAHKQRNKQ